MSDQTIVLISLVSLFGYFFIFTFVLKRGNLKRTADRLMAIYLLIVMTWILARTLPYSSQFVPQFKALAGDVETLALILMPVCYCGLVLKYLRVRETRWWQIVGALFVAGFIGVEVYFRFVEKRGLFPLELSRYWFVVLGWLFFMGISFVLGLQEYFRDATKPLHRNRMRYLLLAISLTMAGDGLCIAQPSYYEPLGMIAKWLGVLTLAYAITSHRMLDMVYLLRRLLSYTISALLTISIYLGIVLSVQYVVGPSYSSLLLGFIAVTVLLALFGRSIHDRIEQLVERAVLGHRFDLGQSLHDYSLDIANIIYLEGLALVAVGTIRQALGIRHGTLLLVDREGSGQVSLHPVKAMGPIPNRDGVFVPDSPLAVLFRRGAQTMTQYDIDLLPELEGVRPEEREWLRELAQELFVPIKKHDEVIGLFALGAKSSGEPYLQEELDFLTSLAGQTAVVLENARLVQNLRELNVELKKANEELAHTDRTKTNFIQIASHELKTPLTQVQGYADILSSTDVTDLRDPAFIQQCTRGIVTGTMRMNEIVDSLLDVARLDAEIMSLHLQPVSLNHIVKRVLEQLPEAVTERKQTIHLEGFSTVPEIKADRERLQQVLLNVIGNAIKYTPDGGTITVSAEMPDSVNDLQVVQVVVRDTGIGIDLEDQQRIFNKFYRVGDPSLHSTGKTKFKGAGPGLGLTIAKGIVEAHGGRIWVQSEGHDEQNYPGSAFFILLPVDPGQSQIPEKGAGKLDEVAVQETRSDF